MLRRFLLATLLPLALAAPAVHAAGVSELLGQPITGLRGQNIGPVEEVIIDVREARVLYVIVQGTHEFFTVPVRGLHRTPGNGELRLDMALEGEAARIEPQADPRFRRAGRLLGQRIDHPGDGLVGTIQDIAFDPATGQIDRVIVMTTQGERALPPEVLAQGRFPPVTLWPEEPGAATGR